MKKLVSYLLLVVLLLSILGQAQAASPAPKARGVDVSSHQGYIAWDITEKYIDFAMLRVGYGQDRVSQDDTQWYNNVKACTRLGIPFGAYIYSYATTEAAVYSEVRHVLRLLEGYSPSLPVYLDLEYSGILQNCTPEQILNHATIFCEMIRAAGYTPGIYANTTWWEKYLTSPKYDQWERWVAQYSNQLNYNRPYSMWQYSDKGTVKGIQGAVDLNYWYGDSFTAGCPHSYTSYLVQETTCTVEGIRIYTCSLCNNCFEERTKPYGHKYTETVIRPTCTEGGYTIYECHCGSGYIGNETSATSHNMYIIENVIKMPTQEEGGLSVHSCRKCGTKIWEEYLPSIKEHMATCESAAYKDAPPYLHWAHEAIDDVLYRGTFCGVGEDRFDPDGAMTRAMVVMALWRYEGCPAPKKVCNFVDVKPNTWYAEAVAWAHENGIVNGVGEGRFDPMGKITREQLATILYRNAIYLGWWVPTQEEILYIFPDGNSVSSYARTPLTWAVNMGIITGTMTNDTIILNPKGIATRAQAVTILARWSWG